MNMRPLYQPQAVPIIQRRLMSGANAAQIGMLYGLGDNAIALLHRV